MRGKSVCRSEEDLYIPLGVCLVARVPTKAIFTMVRVAFYNNIQQQNLLLTSFVMMFCPVLVLFDYEASRNVYNLEPGK